MSIKKTEHPYGYFEVDMKEILTVNDELEWSLKFVAKKEIAAGGSIKIVVPAYQHQRSVEYLQTYDYWKPNYIYAYGVEDETAVDVAIDKVESSFSHIRRWLDSSRVALVSFKNGLNVDEEITVKFGGIDRPWLEGECEPSRVTQHAKEALVYRSYIDVHGHSDYEEVECFPKVKVYADEASKVKIYAPSIVHTDTKYQAKVIVTDRFNNPTETKSLGLYLINLETGKKEDLSFDDGYHFSISSEGYYNIVATWDNIVEPAAILCKNDSETLYWGDMHTHSNLTANIRDNDGGANPDLCYEYGKDISCMDFMCMSEQTFKFDDDRSVNIDEPTWKIIGEVADRHNKSNEFITFGGVELHSKRGDTIVMYGDSFDEFKYPDSSVEDVKDIWSYYKDEKILTIPHFHRYCEGRPNKDQQEKKHSGFELKNWMKSDEQECLCEVYSSQWGRFEHQSHPMILKARANIPHNTVSEFLEKGKRWGFTAGSDGHDGRPGYGGLTGVYSRQLDRVSIYNELKNRKTIASTHTRVGIHCSINNLMIGDESDIMPELRSITGSVVSPTKIKRVDLVRNGEALKNYVVSDKYLSFELLDNELLESANYYLRVFMEDGHIAWTSPIWFN